MLENLNFENYKDEHYTHMYRHVRIISGLMLWNKKEDFEKACTGGRANICRRSVEISA